MLYDPTAPFGGPEVAAATRRAYACDWRDFRVWCTETGRRSLPAEPETVAAYLAARAVQLKPASLERRLAALRFRHRQAGHDLDPAHPRIAEVRAGIRRQMGVAPQEKDALTPAEVQAIALALPSTPAGARDRALILLGFAGALRRAELVALERRDLVFTSEGMAVVLRRAKTDQEGRSMIKGVGFGARLETCPVKGNLPGEGKPAR